MLIFLTGFMGAGKSSVGRLLSRRLEVPLIDLDALIEAQEGRTVAEIFCERGEAVFRRLEREVLVRTAAESRGVVATGGGVVEDPHNVDTMASAGRIVWLAADFETIAARLRLATQETRPLYKTRAEARALYDRRLIAYARCDHRVAVGPTDSPAEVADRIFSELDAGGPACDT